MVHVIMDPRAEPVLVSGTRFWLVTPKLDITGVSGLETLTSGPYIAIDPGKGTPQRLFTAVEAPASADKAPKHLKIVLTADRRGSLKSGSPVYYRQIKVGEVTGAELARTADHVDVHVAVEEKYAPLVRENTRFWNVSGIGVDFGLFRGGQIKTESLESILAGGVSFATPDNDTMGKPVKNGAIFPLQQAPEKEWLTWRPKIPL
jgi:paraquat-inducible protein B